MRASNILPNAKPWQQLFPGLDVILRILIDVRGRVRLVFWFRVQNASDGGDWGPVALAVFKTVVSRNPGWVGSTPIHLRQTMNKSDPVPPPDPRRALPSVDLLLRQKEARALLDTHPRSTVIEAVQSVLNTLRISAAAGDSIPSSQALWTRIAAALDEAGRDRLRPVVNATGIILHTGLGRAVLPPSAVAALAALDRCVNLQIDLETGLRGKRNAETESLLCRLTGAEAALVVNNNAAATLLALAALCAGRDVLVSRGQLIEIGGSFRLPDCVHQSGARLVEVGTTNKTHLADYAAALTDAAGALLRVNPSNYRIVGFTESVSTAELATLKSGRDVIVIDDLGSGALLDPRRFGLPPEPTVPDSIAAGADLVLFSGDKLIGGPQAGIIVGRRDLVRRIRKHPLTRMMRVGKMTDLVLQHTLRLFLDPDTLTQRNPTLRMLTLPVAELETAAARLRQALSRIDPALEADIVHEESSVGGGSFPGHPIPTVALAVRIPTLTAEDLNRRLRRHEPPVIARIREDRVLLDLRTFLEGDETTVLTALTRIAKEGRSA
jgi:L-seryl-tRNA(Ser) seleniumtransferase